MHSLKASWRDAAKIVVASCVSSTVIYLVVVEPDRHAARIAREFRQAKETRRFLVDQRPTPDTPETRTAVARAVCSTYGVFQPSVPPTVSTGASAIPVIASRLVSTVDCRPTT